MSRVQTESPRALPAIRISPQAIRFLGTCDEKCTAIYNLDLVVAPSLHCDARLAKHTKNYLGFGLRRKENFNVNGISGNMDDSNEWSPLRVAARSANLRI